ncbi:ribonucleotide reductase inhibiting protein SML1 KNAG_0E03910 [Huiozyma naganishii CBS 8797]|uniref:Uncharacterized protein n=1 Tax=Huiozyma naganishii (strain ATCC MYA-139 / BCRC 22969 / CBS 8797 / KCTC 17520 / NBRC 10181 / NCYC 3082 / Yp74L-3) TaxID=1071383 RepID=J7R708_HUIN7|nr:hypothetical protein KNAG_0E03910 [Kazachstania naganishii CBS 8797]CCK70645.1 hypothetical protein KNAG_0E03910 [Kazachstania naganishii CBS 8797]
MSAATPAPAASTTEQQRQAYLRDVHQAADRVKQHVQTLHSPQLAQQQPVFERRALNQAPPMLAQNAMTGSGSTLEMWEEGVEKRLDDIDRKLGGSDLSDMFAKGKVEDMDF